LEWFTTWLIVGPRKRRKHEGLFGFLAGTIRYRLENLANFKTSLVGATSEASWVKREKRAERRKRKESFPAVGTRSDRMSKMGEGG